MLYSMTALDVLFLRDAKPFETGESHHARSVFPPSPETVLGMLRAVLTEDELRAHRLSFSEFTRADATHVPAAAIRQLLGHGPDELGRIQFRGPFLWSEDGASGALWFPIPLDVMQVEIPRAEQDDDEKPEAKKIVQFRVLQPNQSGLLAQYTTVNSSRPLASSMAPLALGELPGVEAEPPTDQLLPADALSRALQGETTPVGQSAPDLWDTEIRTGIKIQRDTGAVEPGMLYSAETVRPRFNFRILADLAYRNPDAEPSARAWTARLGGGGHVAAVEAVEPPHAAATAFAEVERGTVAAALKTAVLREQGRFKLYFMTPALFERGWLPDGIDDTGVVSIAGRDCRLVAATVGKPEVVGGWDLAVNRPKPLRLMIPAGSVYFFEPVEQLDDQAQQAFVDELFAAHHLQPYLHAGSFGSPIGTDAEAVRFAQSGFGLTLVGSWSYVL